MKKLYLVLLLSSSLLVTPTQSVAPVIGVLARLGSSAAVLNGTLGRSSLAIFLALYLKSVGKEKEKNNIITTENIWGNVAQDGKEIWSGTKHIVGLVEEALKKSDAFEKLKKTTINFSEKLGTNSTNDAVIITNDSSDIPNKEMVDDYKI